MCIRTQGSTPDGVPPTERPTARDLERRLRRAGVGAALGALVGLLVGAITGPIELFALYRGPHDLPAVVHYASWHGSFGAAVGFVCGGPAVLAGTMARRLRNAALIGSLVGLLWGGVEGYRSAFIRPFFSPADPLPRRYIVRRTVERGVLGSAGGAGFALMIGLVLGFVRQRSPWFTRWE